jgi:hypothetical protein
MKCSTNSRHNQEQWVGSASPAQVWIALSHPKPWGASALASIAIGDQNRKHLTTIFSIYADSRIQIITQNNSSEIVLFFAVAFEHDQRLYRIPLANYDCIRDLNWQDIIDNKPAYQKYISPTPIYLICTNDQHDPCCGKWGQALFDQSQSTENLWQCSHLGGDRFAANVVSLPAGNYYRQVDSDALKSIIESEKQNTLYVDRFAGRSCYDRITQVAFHHLLRTYPQTGINDWSLVGKEEKVTLRFSIGFLGKNDRKVIVDIEQINTGISDFFNCHATTKTEIVYFQLHALKVVNG